MQRERLERAKASGINTSLIERNLKTTEFWLGEHRSNLARWEKEIAGLESKLSPLEEERKSVIDVEDGGNGNVESLQQEIDDLIDDEREQRKIVRELKQNLYALRNERGIKEEEFVSAIERVVEDGVEKHIEGITSRAESELREMLRENAEKAKTLRDRAISSGLETRFFKGGKVDRAQIKRDWDTITSSNPDSIVEDLLRREGMTPSEISDAMADEDFVKQARADVASAVAKMHLLRGGWFGREGKVSTDEILKFGQSEWGRDVIENGIRGRDDMKKQIDEAIGKGVVDAKGRLTEKFRNMPAGDMLKLLMIVLGVGAVGVIAGPALATGAGIVI
jgi:hypothetical protein